MKGQRIEAERLGGWDAKGEKTEAAKLGSCNSGLQMRMLIGLNQLIGLNSLENGRLFYRACR